MRSALIGILGAALVTAPFSVGAQAVARIALKPADAKLEEEFTLVGSVRELRDGRVLVTDPRDNRVVVIDFKSGAVTQVGRAGRGPREYGSAAPVRAIAGDSSIMFDASTGRWHLFNGAQLVATLPPDTGIVRVFGRSASGVDARGFVWRTAGGQMPTTGTKDMGAGDSVVLVRGNRATAVLDTVLSMRAVNSRISVQSDARGQMSSMSVMMPPFAVGEEAMLFPDGWFAIARLEPYRVDWINAQGVVQKGTPLPVPVVKISEREKDAYQNRRTASGRGTGSPPPASIARDFTALSALFPDVYPPFDRNGLLAAPNNQLLVRRNLTADFPDARYDVVDRRSRLVGVITMPKGERIAGFGPTSVYVAWKDDDDIERLRRHPWP